MLVARSYSFGSQQRRNVSRDEEKQALRIISEKRNRQDAEPRGFGWRPASYERTASQFKSPPHLRRESTDSLDSLTSSPKSSPIPTARRQGSYDGASLPHSRPVDVPSRSSQTVSSIKSGPQHKPGAYTSHSREPRQFKNGSRNGSAPSPSVTSLLAGTKIPARKKHPHRDLLKSASHRRQSLSELRAEWDQVEPESSPLGSSPTMDLLLSAPTDDDFILSDGLDEGSPQCSSMPSRTVSSDSILSLEPDAFLNGSASPTLSPSLRPKRRNTIDRRPKFSPRSVEADSHPLVNSLNSDEEDDDYQTSEDTASFSSSSRRSEQGPTSAPKDFRRKPSKPPLARSSSSTFKSNLTASFAALKSAARSFSNFAATSIAPDDHVSRGLLGIPYHPEMRPRPMDGTPNAAMRRYLNPQHHEPAGDFHLHGAQFDHTDLELVASIALSHDLLTGTSPPEAVIAMQSLEKKQSQSSKAATEAGRAMNVNPAEQQKLRREPRENNEFLRICVLEMNMRRSGKMEGPVGMGQGRRAWWLPPRSLDLHAAAPNGAGPADARGAAYVPPRWISTSA